MKPRFRALAFKVGLVLLAGAAGTVTSRSSDLFIIIFCGCFWAAVTAALLWMLHNVRRATMRSNSAASGTPVPAHVDADRQSDADDFHLINSPRPLANGHSEEELRWLRG